MKKGSIYNFVYLAVFLLITSIIIYLNIIYQENLKKEIILQFNRQQVLLARGAAMNIEKQVDHYVQHLITLSQFPGIKEMDGSFVKNQILLSLLNEMPKEDSTSVNFRVIDKRGRVRLDASYPSTVGRDVSSQPYFYKTRQLLRGEVAVSDMTHLADLNPAKRYIVISTPLYGRERAGVSPLNGVALFAVSVDDIAGAYVSQIRMGERGYAWVMDDKGTLVFHPSRSEMIGRNILKADKSCFGCHKSFDAERRILTGAVMEYGIYTAPLGEDKLISYSKAKVGSESWLVCVTIPYSEVTGLIAKSMRLYSWLISIIFFSAAAALVYFVGLIKKKTAADERARYAATLEDRIAERTSELSREKEKLNAILSGFGAGVSLLDRDYNIVWANECINQNAGYPVSRKCFEAYRGLLSPCEGCPLPAVFETGKMGRVEVMCRKSGDGMNGDLLTMLTEDRVGYFHVIISPIKDAGGQVVQVVELIQDITAMRKLEQQMVHSEKLAALGRISAGIAHEIGNPMTSISSYIQILQENRYDEFTDNALEVVSSHINRIKGILQQMTSCSRSYNIEKARMDLNESVKAAIDLMEYEKGMKECQLLVSYHPEPLIIFGDEKWMVSVFVNLILNALDAMTGRGRIVVNTFRKEYPGPGRMAVVEVSDTGAGIPHENLEKIFDPFFTTKRKGTGMGLAVSYNIIKDLNGDISVASIPGEGTTFIIRLPMEEGHA